ncbi:hypothetical protein [Prosthecobacter sp.]|uniref:hypothetical protein n=1 Tax=Prosthecobacter sp. TaxID=1965333 RepID=UPI003783969C
MSIEKLSEQRLSEHAKGWVLTLDSMPMFRLDFLSIEPPCYLFRLTPLNSEAEQIVGNDQAMKQMLDSGATSFVSSQEQGITVGTDCFWACKETSSTLLLRDARPW